MPVCTPCVFGADLDSLAIVHDWAGTELPAKCGAWNDGGLAAETFEREGELAMSFSTDKLSLNQMRAFCLCFLYSSHLAKRM